MLQQRRHWPPAIGVIFGEFVPDLWTICYFNPQVSWIPMVEPDAAHMAAYEAQYAREGNALYVDWTYLQKTGHPAARFTFEPVGMR